MLLYYDCCSYYVCVCCFDMCGNVVIVVVGCIVSHVFIVCPVCLVMIVCPVCL